MRVIIVGAGEVGKQVAKVLCYRKNDVVVVDLNAAVLEDLKTHLDIMTVVGNGATGRQLLRAGVEKAAMVLAVTDNNEANILTCWIAKKFNVATKIARIRSNEYFDAAHDLTSEAFGVDHGIIPEYECATDIYEVLLRPAIKETVKFNHPDAQMVNFQISPGSPMIGAALKEFPRPDLLLQLRVCAVLRQGRLIIPGGEFSFLAFDEIYVAGAQPVIDDLISWSEPETPLISKVIIAGGTPIGRFLALMLINADIRVCVIEPDAGKAEKTADILGTSVLIIQGETTDISVLEEAGIQDCDAFVAVNVDDETNILSCILAKDHRVGKVISVTTHSEYLQIISGMKNIDSCFSPLVSAVNILINHIKTENRQTVAMLKRTSSEVLEMTVSQDSKVSGMRIQDIELPVKMVFALIIRGRNLGPAVGPEELVPGDHVIVMTEAESVPEVDKLFTPKGLFA